jgi:hypothetical protein
VLSPENLEGVMRMKMERYLQLALAVAVLLVICHFFYNR